MQVIYHKHDKHTQTRPIYITRGMGKRGTIDKISLLFCGAFVLNVCNAALINARQ